MPNTASRTAAVLLIPSKGDSDLLPVAFIFKNHRMNTIEVNKNSHARSIR